MKNSLLLIFLMFFLFAGCNMSESRKNALATYTIATFDGRDSLVFTNLSVDSSRFKDILDLCIIDSVSIGWIIYNKDPILFECLYINDNYPYSMVFSIDSIVRGQTYISKLEEIKPNIFRIAFFFTKPIRKQIFTSSYLICTDSSEINSYYLAPKMDKWLDSIIDTSYIRMSIPCKIK